MTESELKDCIFGAISEIAPEAIFDDLNPDKGLREQLDLDSMDFLNVIIALHAKLGVDIPEKDYPRLFTLNGAIRYLAQRTAGRQGQ
jgi:acyl carrier protein